MSEFFAPSGALQGTLRAPADKSISHRAALLGAMSSGEAVVRNYLESADTRSTLEAINALGARVRTERTPAGLEVTIGGVGLRGARPPQGPQGGEPVDVGNAGTLIRLLSGWLAGQPAGSFELTGDASIRSRPMGRIAAPLREMGAGLETSAEGTPPLRIEARPLRGISYRMPVASAQVKSALLLAGLLAEGETKVSEPEPTRDHTERMLRAAGVRVGAEERTALPTGPSPLALTVSAAEELSLPPLTVPGDISSAAFHICAALLVPGSRVRVEGVGLNPTRVGILGILNRMGAAIEVEELRHEAGEPVGAITARHAGGLKATRVAGAEIPLAIDELPLVALLGCFAEGETVVTEAAELRHKESDRIAAVVDGLRALGAEIDALEDGFVVRGTGSLRGGRIESGGDHRIALLGAIAGLASREGVEVEGMEAAAVSYPGFGRDLGALLG